MKIKPAQAKKLAKSVYEKLTLKQQLKVLSSERTILEKIEAAILGDAQKADEVDKKVRATMDKIAGQMESGEIDYQKMYPMVRKQVMKELKFDPDMAERFGHIALKLHDRLYLDNDVDYTDEDASLLLMKQVILTWVKNAMGVDERVLERLSTQKRNVQVGTNDWEIWYNKFFEEEMSKL